MGCCSIEVDIEWVRYRGRRESKVVRRGDDASNIHRAARLRGICRVRVGAVTHQKAPRQNIRSVNGAHFAVGCDRTREGIAALDGWIIDDFVYCGCGGNRCPTVRYRPATWNVMRRRGDMVLPP